MYFKYEGMTCVEKYIGFKMIEAEPMTAEEAGRVLGRPIDTSNGDTGYLVQYIDGYKSWSPASAFEPAYMQVGDNSTITQELVDNFIVAYEVITQQNKITIVTATLANNFTIVESSGCVDPANHNEMLATEICKTKIKDKVWFLLGFLLQTAKDGVCL